MCVCVAGGKWGDFVPQVIPPPGVLVSMNQVY